MHYLIAFIYFLFALLGIDGQGSRTIVTRSVSDGVAVLYATARITGGVAEVSCISSASGRCHYRLVPDDCVEPPPSLSPPPDCKPDSTRQFVLAAGSTRALAVLSRGLALCVSQDAPRPGPDCESLAEVSSVLR